MEFKNYETVSSEVKGQINRIVEVWKKYLDKELVGVYLHGSMCINCFREASSDIDLLIITNRRIDREERLKIAGELIEVDQKPCPIEMSAVAMSDLVPWKHPVKCQFHYSDFWTERYKQTISGKLKENYIVDNDFEDADVTSYVKLINQSGVCLYGKAIKEVFPEVSDEDFWDAISAEVDDYDFDAYNDRYFVSNILILGRILSFKVEKVILSKYEGGLWALDHVPEKYCYIIDNAIKVWYSDEKLVDYKKEDLEGLKNYLIEQIKAE